MMRKLFALRRDESGAAIIEMALMMPILATLLIGMVDISRGYSAKLQLEQAAQRAIEMAMQGKKTTSLYNSLRAEGAAAAGVNTSAVTVDFWLECDDVRQASYDAVCPVGQTYARYVTVAIQKVYTPMFSTRFAGARTDGTYLLTGEAGIRVQ